MEAPEAKVFLMGPSRHKLSWSEIVSKHPDIDALAADEPHMYWSKHGSQATFALYACMEKLTRFVPMTGTVIKGRLDSAYPLIHVIEPRYYASYEVFMKWHSERNEYGRLMWKDTKRIAQIFGQHALKRSFVSEYGPEAKVIVSETCEMHPDQKEAYKEFEDKAILELEEAFLQAKEGGVHALRCRQILSHPETWGIAKGEKTKKDELLEVHLAHHQDTGEPLVIFAAFKAEQRRITELVLSHGISCELLNGDTPVAKRGQIDRDFRAGTLQCIVGSPQVAVVGYNWQHCDKAIFTSMDYGDDTFYQAYRRFIRGVRSTPLLIYVLQYANTIEQRIMWIIQRKSRLGQLVDESREVYEL